MQHEIAWAAEHPKSLHRPTDQTTQLPTLHKHAGHGCMDNYPRTAMERISRPKAEDAADTDTSCVSGSRTIENVACGACWKRNQAQIVITFESLNRDQLRRLSNDLACCLPRFFPAIKRLMQPAVAGKSITIHGGIYDGSPLRNCRAAIAKSMNHSWQILRIRSSDCKWA